MNAAIFTKSAKGLILASGLIAASTVLGYAQDAPVALGAQATVPLSTLYVSAPSGSASLGGHTFDLSGGNLIPLASGQSATFTGSWLNASGAYLLLNSANTSWWYEGSVVGNVTVSFSDGTTQSTDLTVGGNIREWRTGAGFTVNTISDPAAAQVWSGTAQTTVGGGSAVIDMLTISLAGTKTVTSVTLSNTNAWGALQIDLAGLTIDPANPTATCIRPGESCKTPAAQKSEAKKWQPSTAPTADTDKLAKTDADKLAKTDKPAKADKIKHKSE
jgi:hypothetical protein